MSGRVSVRVVLGVLVAVVALLGEGASIAGATPRKVPAASTAESTTESTAESTADWAQLSSGYYHTCGVRSTGRLYCWGQGNRGQLGTGGNGNTAVPTEVSGAATDWRSVSAGSAWTCAIKTNGTLWCWGRDDYGQLGNGPGSADVLVPAQVGSATDWKSVSAGLGETTCGRRANKRIYCWGRDNNGQVGNGPGGFANVETPAAVGANADWSAVSTGGYHVCGRRSNGRVYCWGDDLDGTVGDGGTAPGVDRSVPTQVAGAHADWTSVSAGLTHTCGRRASGRLYCWGSDINGGLGNGGGTNTSQYAPVEVRGGATDWRSVFAGGYVSCATKVNGRLYCWGYDAYGQVGTGVADALDNSAPTLVAGAATDWKTATIGNLHVCARKLTSRIFCWGYGFFGQRGDGVSGNNNAQPTPTEVS